MKSGSILIITIGLIVISSCLPVGADIPPDIVAAVEKTQTAAVWTATPVPTIVPSPVRIINTLNNEIRGQDILAEMIDAKYYITDVDFASSGNSPVLYSIQIDIECESLNRPTCSRERAFVILMHALQNKKVRKVIFEQVPTTVQEFILRTLDHMRPIGLISARWSDIVDFAEGNLTAEQLGARISLP